jgi:hypothetical protein
MKRLAFLALAAALGCGLAAAQQTTGGTGQDQAPAGMQGTQGTQQGRTGRAHRWGMTHRFHGTVQAVDASSGRITVRDKKGQTRDFTAGSNAKIMQGKTKVSVDALSVGDNVTVKYKGSKNAPQVEKLWIRKGK